MPEKKRPGKVLQDLQKKALLEVSLAMEPLFRETLQELERLNGRQDIRDELEACLTLCREVNTEECPR